jgi:monovalent cation/proton antiporter MnhG/PhaG subunit
VTENIVVDVLFAVGVGAELVCSVGVLVMRTTYDRLHYSSAGSTVGAFCILAALLVREGLSSGGLQGIAAVGLLFLLGPLVIVATARAARRIERGDLEPSAEELERGR